MTVLAKRRELRADADISDVPHVEVAADEAHIAPGIEFLIDILEHLRYIGVGQAVRLYGIPQVGEIGAEDVARVEQRHLEAVGSFSNAWSKSPWMTVAYCGVASSLSERSSTSGVISPPASRFS